MALPVGPTINRRDLLAGTATATVVAPPTGPAQAASAPPPADPRQPILVELRVNGRHHRLTKPPMAPCKPTSLDEAQAEIAS